MPARITRKGKQVFPVLFPNRPTPILTPATLVLVGTVNAGKKRGRFKNVEITR